MISALHRWKLCARRERRGALNWTALFLLAPTCPGGAAAITWTNTAGGNWATAANWSPGQVPGAADDAAITASGAYTVTLNASATVRSLTLGGAAGQQTLTNNNSTLTLTNPSVVNANGVLAWGGGTLSGGGLTVNGQFLWNNGTLAGPLTIATNGVLNVTGGTPYLGGALTNAGTVNWTGGTFEVDQYDYGYSAGPVVNVAGGQWNIQCDQSLVCRGSTTTNTYFLNAGTLTKLAGTGSTSVNVPFYNTGAVNAAAGTLNFQDGGTIGGTYSAGFGTTILFSGGSFNAGAAPALSGLGNIQLTGGSLLLGSSIIPNLQLTGGAVTLGAGFEGGAITNLTLSGSTLAGSNTVSGVMNWASGVVAGSLTVSTGGVLTLSGSSAMYLGGTSSPAWMAPSSCGFPARRT